MQQSFFEGTTVITDMPLAEKVRPSRLEDIEGHDEILGPSNALRIMLDSDDFSSFILWGPPGSGKTTIAKLIEQNTEHGFCSFSAVLAKIGDVKDLMQRARRTHVQQNRSTLVFIDEIHRFNKSQQDAFLPYVESGAVVLIGATTENPSFEVIPALLSRCHVFALAPLEDENIVAILKRALPHLGKSLELTEDAFQFLSSASGGDARRALNDLELICQNSESGDIVEAGQIDKLLSTRPLFYDKGGEEHFNLISALQKSIRGSDPQAALYWLARMVEAGEDPLYITRRLVRIASEDIGLADPQALVQAIAVKEAVHFLGMPEANTALTQLTIYLATAPKSNALEVAYHSAKEDAIKSSHLKVPLVIRNAPTRLMKKLGYGKNYKYSHDYENHYQYQRYFPDKLEEKEYYHPSQFGFEKEIQKRINWWSKLRKNQEGKADDHDPSDE